jgi:hypothetical protein
LQRNSSTIKRIIRFTRQPQILPSPQPLQPLPPLKPKLNIYHLSFSAFFRARPSISSSYQKRWGEANKRVLLLLSKPALHRLSGHNMAGKEGCSKYYCDSLKRDTDIDVDLGNCDRMLDSWLRYNGDQQLCWKGVFCNEQS